MTTLPLMEQTTPLSSPGRIHVVDALRGFAVMAIFLVHALEHFIYDSYPTYENATWGEANKLFFDAFFFLFAGKSYTIFALLFGFTFAVQVRNQRAKARDFAGRFAWRMVLLAGFACVNSIFFPGGDVLMTFAIAGLVMIPFRDCSLRTLTILCLFFLLQPQQIMYSLIQWGDPSWKQPDLGVGGLYASLKPLIDSGDFLGMAWKNVTVGQWASFLWGVDAGRLMQAPGLFFLGYILCKGDFFAKGERQTKFWIRSLMFSVLGSFVFYICMKLPAEGAPWRTIFTMWHNVCFTGIWCSVFVLVYRFEFFRNMVRPLESYGKMSLTNYISQSVIGAIVFFPFALGLAPVLGMIPSFAVGCVAMCGQVIFCRKWLKTHKYGPLEGLWHKLTWMK